MPEGLTTQIMNNVHIECPTKRIMSNVQSEGLKTQIMCIVQPECLTPQIMSNVQAEGPTNNE